MRSDACLKLEEVSCVARPSNLSRCQVLEVQSMIARFYPSLRLKVSYLKSGGDHDKISSLRNLNRTNFFTDVLDEALLQGQCQIAVHSAKDLPNPIPQGLHLAAITPCLDARDVLVFRQGIDLSKPLPEGLKIATSSTHREKAAAQLAPNPTFRDLRGTIEERLALLETHRVDAVVIAWAALLRLKLTHLPTLFLPGETIPGQGSLAIVTRKEDEAMIELFSILDTRIERPSCYYLGIDPCSYATPFALTHAPIIETKNLLSKAAELQQRLLTGYERASHILLTSPRSARYLWEVIQGRDELLALATTKHWLCIGPASAAALGDEARLRRVCPTGSSAEALGPHLSDLQGAFVLYPHSRQARPLLKEILEGRGIEHLALPIYETVQTKLPVSLDLLRGADELILTSPSCVESLYAQMTPSALTKLTPIGPVTELALQKYQMSR